MALTRVTWVNALQHPLKLASRLQTGFVSLDTFTSFGCCNAASTYERCDTVPVSECWATQTFACTLPEALSCFAVETSYNAHDPEW